MKRHKDFSTSWKGAPLFFQERRSAACTDAQLRSGRGRYGDAVLGEELRGARGEGDGDAVGCELKAELGALGA